MPAQVSHPPWHHLCITHLAITMPWSPAHPDFMSTQGSRPPEHRWPQPPQQNPRSSSLAHTAPPEPSPPCVSSCLPASSADDRGFESGICNICAFTPLPGHLGPPQPDPLPCCHLRQQLRPQPPRLLTRLPQGRRGKGGGHGRERAPDASAAGNPVLVSPQGAPTFPPPPPAKWS